MIGPEISCKAYVPHLAARQLNLILFATARASTEFARKNWCKWSMDAWRSAPEKRGTNICAALKCAGKDEDTYSQDEPNIVAGVICNTVGTGWACNTPVHELPECHPFQRFPRHSVVRVGGAAAMPHAAVPFPLWTARRGLMPWWLIRHRGLDPVRPRATRPAKTLTAINR